MYSLIDHFPIKLYIKDALKLNRIKTDKDVLSHSPDELVRITSLSSDEVKEVFDSLNNPIDIYTEDPFTNIEKNFAKIPIPSLLNSLDEMLENGFQTGKMYQIFGEAGSGKTQLCLQLSCNVQIPKLIGGNQASVIFIDTENSFKPERFIEIASLTIDRVQRLTNSQDPFLSIEKMIKNLFIFKCIEPQQLIAILLHQLEKIIIDKKPKLIVVDSIAYQFRYGYEEAIHFKRKKLVEISQKLKHLAFKYDICVICVNQITCDIDKEQLLPSLGYYWNHSPFGHLRFTKIHSNIRAIQGEKGCYKKGKIYFKIEKSGISELDDADFDQIHGKFQDKEESEWMLTQNIESFKDYEKSYQSSKFL